MKHYKLLALSVFLVAACGEKEGNPIKEGSSSVGTSSNRDKITNNLFEKIDSEASGITFSNTLKEDVGTIENLFDFDYFYNGAGVGIADIDNDGLNDIFFTGNQVENKLYLNKGNLKFEDISLKAGINKGKQWSNGVTFADVNGDGWLDIYVSQGGPRQQADRKNLLFINQKDQTFKEAAASYGLDDSGIGTQSVFFDYDRDGDLDCVVSNENELYGLDPVRFFKTMESNKEILKKSSVQFYRNDGGKYKRITERVGLLRPAFGLGVTVSDINNDGWLDIYIANDYYVPDVIYINDKNGGFTDRTKEMTNQISFYGMGVDIADINNDNLQDIFVLDMASSDHIRSKTLMASMNLDRFNLLTEELGLAHQYMFNSLQLNMGDGKFHNTAHMAHLAKTDWSWAGLIADLDNDTRKDIYVTNGYRRYALDNDLQLQVRDVQRAFSGNVPLDAKQKLYDAMPSEKLSNIMYVNQGDLYFENEAYQWGLSEPSFSNGAAYADLDNDGDLELVVNNLDDTAFLYKNNAVEKGTGNFLSVRTEGENSEAFAKVAISTNGTTQIIEAKRVHGYLSSMDDTAHFGLGDVETVDTVTVQWPNGKREQRLQVPANSFLEFKQADANDAGDFVFQEMKNSRAPSEAVADNSKLLGIPRFQNGKSNLGLSFNHKENPYNDFDREVLLPYKQSTFGPSMAKGDVNGDGLEDLFVGGASGQAAGLFIQGQDGFSRKRIPAFVQDAVFEDMEAVFFDLDGDYDQDIFVVSGGNEFPPGSPNYIDRIYVNDGKGNFTRMPQNFLARNPQSGKSVVAFDFDKDGDMDIAVGNRIEPQHFPVSAPSTLYENREGLLVDVTPDLAPSLLDFGIVNKIIATDFDGDGWEDLMAVGEWSPIGMFRNDHGKLKEVTKQYGLDNEKGWWFSIAETDVNQDGQKDYIVGNVGKNVKYKTSTEKPFKVFAHDFDSNGTFDLVLSNEYNGNYVPARGKECSTQQMPFISEKFETYNAFANSTLEDIYGNALNDAYQGEVTRFGSIVLIANGNKGFDIVELPSMAQTTPIMGIVTKDLNGDGFGDAIVAGNIFDAEVETPRMDAPYGVVLISNGKDGYTALSPSQTRLYLSGDVKSLMTIDQNGKTLLLAGQNNGPLEVLEMEMVK